MWVFASILHLNIFGTLLLADCALVTSVSCISAEHQNNVVYFSWQSLAHCKYQGNLCTSMLSISFHLTEQASNAIKLLLSTYNKLITVCALKQEIIPLGKVSKMMNYTDLGRQHSWFFFNTNELTGHRFLVRYIVPSTFFLLLSGSYIQLESSVLPRYSASILSLETS